MLYMFNAEVGDDVYIQNSYSFGNKKQRYSVCRSVFPSGIMANQTAIK
jgi:hypothetical protein